MDTLAKTFKLINTIFTSSAAFYIRYFVFIQLSTYNIRSELAYKIDYEHSWEKKFI